MVKTDANEGRKIVQYREERMMQSVSQPCTRTSGREAEHSGLSGPANDCSQAVSKLLIKH